MTRRVRLNGARRVAGWTAIAGLAACGTRDERGDGARARWEYATLTVEGGGANAALIWTAPDTAFIATSRDFAAHFPGVHVPAHLNGTELALNTAGARGWALVGCYAYALTEGSVVTVCDLKRQQLDDAWHAARP